MEKVYTMDLAGSQLKVTIGKVAEQANGACLVQYGETVVLVTATSSSKPREGIDFFSSKCWLWRKNVCRW